MLATLLDLRYKGHVSAVDTLSKMAQKWLKEEHAIMSEQQKAATTGDQGSDPKQKKLEVEEEEEPGPSGLLDQMYAHIFAGS